MRNRFLSWILLAAFNFFPAAMAADNADPVAGRFVGSARFPDGDIQVTTLDLVPLERNAKGNRYVGLLKLNFGGLRTHEYITFRFPEVRWDPAGKNLVFEPWEQDLNVEGARLDEKTGRLSFQGVSNNRDVTVEFRLARDGSWHDDGPLRSKLQGLYTATCRKSEHPDKISLLTARSFAEAPISPNPYGSYRVFGAQIQWLPDFRGNYRYAAMYAIDSGIYDFLSGEVTLQGTQYFSCRKTPKGILCDDCLYSSDDGDLGLASNQDWAKLPVAPPVVTKIAPPPRVAGKPAKFSGFLNHRDTEISQPLELTLDIADGKGAAQAVLLFSRKEQEPARLSYRFEMRALPEMTATGITFFNIPRPFAPADAVLHITHVDEQTVRGIWLSWFYGYVGDFEATRNSAAPSPRYPRGMSAMDGVYDGGVFPVYQARYIVGVQTLPGRFLPRTDNPFFPLTLGGYLIVNSGMTPGVHQRFTDGAVDFYTGHFNIGNYWVGDVDLGKPEPEFQRVDIALSRPGGFAAGLDYAGSWRWSMPFRVFRAPKDYWPRLDGYPR